MPVDVARLWWATAIALAGLFVLTSVVVLFDQRLIAGESVWAKPLRFQLSLALHFATLAAIVHGLGEDWRAGGLLLAVAVVSIVSATFEIAYIMLQAARQQQSHFNLTTPFYATMYAMMAIGAVFIIGAAGIVGGIVAFDSQARFDAVLRTGIALGLIGGTILTLVTAFTIGSRLDRHAGVEVTGAMRMPLTGWSLEVGDLRVSHFFATHMIQAVPAAAWIAQSLLPRGIALAAVGVFAAIWVALTLTLYRSALAGVPLARLI